jgi:hypothetical protein
MKVFKFEKRIQATLVEFYEVTAETEEDALDMVMDGKGLQESFTETDDFEVELYDTEDPADWDENGFPKAEK